jgi:hypothetical protein
LVATRLSSAPRLPELLEARASVSPLFMAIKHDAEKREAVFGQHHALIYLAERTKG